LPILLRLEWEISEPLLEFVKGSV